MAKGSGAIGVFDSGVGGLTVVRRITDALPAESIVYLGDTARVPYGTKSAETVIRYASACARVLTQRGIKLLVVACNTASAYALETLQAELDIPVLGVVRPGARTAVAATRNHRIGVIGTPGTIASGEYQNTLRELDPEAEIFTQACPLFVPLAEEEWTSGPVPLQVAEQYLAEFRKHDVDTLILGCTHYPLLAAVIGEVMGAGVTLVDSAAATAEVVTEILDAMDLRTANGADRGMRFLVSDAPSSFSRTGQGFLRHAISDVEWVDF